MRLAHVGAATSHPYLRKPSFQSPGSTPSPQMVSQPIPYAQSIPSPMRNSGRHMMHPQSPPIYHPPTPPQTVPATAPTMSLVGLRPDQTNPVSHTSRLWSTRMNSYTQAAPVYGFDDGMVADGPKYSVRHALFLQIYLPMFDIIEPTDELCTSCGSISCPPTMVTPRGIERWWYVPQPPMRDPGTVVFFIID